MQRTERIGVTLVTPLNAQRCRTHSWATGGWCWLCGWCRLCHRQERIDGPVIGNLPLALTWAEFQYGLQHGVQWARAGY